MKYIKSPWLICPLANVYEFAEWQLPGYDGYLSPWICHRRLEMLFELTGVSRIRVVLTDEKPEDSHSIKVQRELPAYTTYKRFKFNDEYMGTLFHELDSWLNSACDRMSSETLYAHLEIK